jgi:hypothetical protein
MASEANPICDFHKNRSPTKGSWCLILFGQRKTRAAPPEATRAARVTCRAQHFTALAVTTALMV